MQGFLNAVNGVVWGAPMLIFFIFTGLHFSFKSRFYQIKNSPKSFKIFLNSIFDKTEGKGISQFSTFCSVLGACIGTGNIVGVATAIYSGGAGTVFWMVVSAFLSMMTAYAENYLGASYSKRYYFVKNASGALLYIENGLNMKGLAKIYAFLCLMSVFGMGNMTQSNSLADAMNVTFNVSPVITSVLIAILSFFIIKGGIKRISTLQTILVPVATLFYLVISAAVLIKFRSNITPCIHLIFTEAFSLKALGGFGMYKAMRYGIARGVFSNEAGLGSSTFLHAQSHNLNGNIQGISAMAEVFIDTIFMCTITALVILVSTPYEDTSLYGAGLSSLAYNSIGSIGKIGVGILTAIFSFLSLISCSFYGESAFNYLFKGKYTKAYVVIYVILVFVGGSNSPEAVWSIADIFNGLMAIPNLFAINCLSKEVQYEQR